MISKITSRHIDPLSLFSGDSKTGGAGSASHPQQPPSYTISDENPALKSGPLFLSCKGIGWSTWKKRWFVLTRTSLVFFRADPSAVPQKGSELNLTLGGIDLNNSGSVVVKEDKKLLTVLFPDGGREGRAFTLKADTLEDIHEWKSALESALAEAPDPPLVDESDTKNGSAEHTKDRQPTKSTVLGRPILLALEEVDGSPSFLEKALRFIEEHGLKVEGILRQAADVEHVERRIREYEQGKTEFSPEEDAHVIADCVKYIMRELPSYPVPASCCKALLEACCKTTGADRNTRINAMRVAICETFPEPNRRLLQRILIMMQTVVSHKNENLMGPSAVAACMAPILLRALMSGDCEIENDFDVGGDGGSMQLMQAAAAANHAQAIAITLLEEYNNIFGEGSISPELYDSEETGSEDEEATDDDESYDDDGTGESGAYSNDDTENESCSESYDSGDDNSDGEKDRDESSSGSKSPEVHDDHKTCQKLSSKTLKIIGNVPNQVDKSNHENQVPIMQKSTTTVDGRTSRNQQSAGWGRAPAKRNHSMESIDYNLEDENDVQNLESTKADLQDRASRKVEGKDALPANLDKQKNPLDEHRLDLVQEVGNLRNTLIKEKNTRIALEAVLKNPVGPLPDLSIIDEKTKAEIQEVAQEELYVAKLKHEVDNLGVKLKCEQNNSSQDAETTQHHEMSSKSTSLKGAATGKPPNFKRSNTRAEGGTSASAHTKLATRLNLLKERHNQIASELQNLEKGQGSDQSTVPNPENRQGSDQDSE